MDFPYSTTSCTNIEDEYTSHQDDHGIALHVYTFAKRLNVIQSYSHDKKKTEFGVEVHVNQEKFFKATTTTDDGEAGYLGTVKTSFVNELGFGELLTLQGCQSKLNDGLLHDFIVSENNIREEFWEKLYEVMSNLVHETACQVWKKNDMIKPNKITVILEIGVARCVDVPAGDDQGEKILRCGLPCSSSSSYDDVDKKYEKDDEVDCSVCHYEVLMGENITRMPCKHLFHSECVFKWLPMHNSCPLCRSPMWGVNGSIHNSKEDVKVQ
ncbi:hypothetical protein FRX31_023644 [Thalictrum thalictroides]|uniref:RING-type E3 ubiquitin transferase n=1 Tax=Thalictrum thalictroides TaxID=46969 RepID=A0A7J6VNT6_THATH|nr:hypothetical protein FRX31_023644 [Thalictrum thalictroides]